MALEELDLKESPDGITIKVKVQPRASKNAIAGLLGGCLKLSLTSPPVEGAANAACIEFVAALCGVAKSKVTIVSGRKSREKIVQVAGTTKAAFLSALAGKV
ncbi:MAG TPA: DUF167 domain-containing protein [Selenomonadales bacterium]|nr:DUF167 domain-containing protein [Selenomonadales bacterium]